MGSDRLNENFKGPVSDVSIPSNGIEETDRAIFNLFNQRLSFEVKVNEQITRVPVVFASGERFSLTRRRQPIRDKNNALILPIIAIVRQNIDFSPGQSGYGTPISFRRQEDYILTKRLSKKDRSYQNLINKLRLKNQKNVSSRANFGSKDIFPGNTAKPGTVATRRNDGNLSLFDDPEGDLLRDNLGTNIFDIISIPYPKFIMITYEVTFWTQYMQQMNQIIETMFNNFDGQDMGFSLKTAEGYEVTAYIKTPLNSADNFSDYSSDERIIRYTFSLNVPTYIIAVDHPGNQSPARVMYSAPQIEFIYNEINAPISIPISNPGKKKDLNSFILSDVNDINSQTQEVDRRNSTPERVLEVIKDPFSGDIETKYVKVLMKNERSGETVSSARVVKELQKTLDDIPE